MDSPVEIGQTLADMATILLRLGARTANTNRSGYMLLAKVSHLNLYFLVLILTDDCSSSDIWSAFEPSRVEYPGMGARITYSALGAWSEIQGG